MMRQEDNKDNLIITFDTIGKHIGKNDDVIANFLARQNVGTIAMAFKYVKNKNDDDDANADNADDDNTLQKSKSHSVSIREVLLKELTRRWYMISIDSINECGYPLLSALLKTDDYSHSNASNVQKNDLEDFLARMVYNWFKNNPVASILHFDHALSMLQSQHIKLNTFGKLVSLPQCVTLRKLSSEFSEKIISIFSFFASGEEITQKYRFSDTENQSKSNVFQIIEDSTFKSVSNVDINDITIGDRFDVKDFAGIWRLAEVKKQTNNTVSVNFLGRNDDYDETFRPKTCIGKFARIGVMTGCIRHRKKKLDALYKCKCCICSKK